MTLVDRLDRQANLLSELISEPDFKKFWEISKVMENHMLCDEIEDELEDELSRKDEPND